MKVNLWIKLLDISEAVYVPRMVLSKITLLKGIHATLSLFGVIPKI